MEEQKTFNQILEELKNLREEKGISLEQIAEQTKIKLKLLKDLEAGNLQNLPGVYDRYIFKTYLEHIEAENIPQLLNLFDKETGRLPGESTLIKQRKARTISERKLVSGFTILKVIYIVIPLLIIILLLVIFLSNYNPNENGNKGAVKELTAMEIVKNSTATSILKQTNEMPDDSLRIEITARDRCWLMHIKDHADTSDVMLLPENRIELKADSVVEMRIGNPAAITLIIGDQTYDSLAAPGEVISYLKITQAGIVSKRIVKPKKEAAKNDSTKNR